MNPSDSFSGFASFCHGLVGVIPIGAFAQRLAFAIFSSAIFIILLLRLVLARELIEINMYARLRRAAPPPHGDVWGECLDASRPVARPSKIQMRLFLSQLEVNSPINFFRWRGQVFYGGGNR